MRESLEMVTASRMQDMVQIREKNTCFVTILLFRNFRKSSFGALGVESPHGGAIFRYTFFDHETCIEFSLILGWILDIMFDIFLIPFLVAHATCQTFKNHL